GSDAQNAGEHLYGTLFSGLTMTEAKKGSWLLSLDDALFSAPFPALIVGGEAGHKNYLIEGHSLQIIPGALSLTRSTSPRQGTFLGVGDPVYNTADSRWRAPMFNAGWFASTVAPPLLSAHASTGGGQLARLVESAAEIDSCSRTWGANS